MNFDISSSLLENFYFMGFDLKNENEWKSVFAKTLISTFFTDQKNAFLKE